MTDIPVPGVPEMSVRLTPHSGAPVGKLYDAELIFNAGPFVGLKLIGFAVWERRGGNGRNVTFPARQYTVNGERRSFALLRPLKDANDSDRVRDYILTAVTTLEARSDGMAAAAGI